MTTGFDKTYTLRTKRHYLLVVFCLNIIVACGGGSSDEEGQFGSGAGTTPANNNIRVVSVDSNGIAANSAGTEPKISSDGRYVVFESYATNLVPDDTNNEMDIFLYDTQTNAMTRVSVDSNGVQGNLPSFSPVISGDGRYVVFESGSTNLVAGDTNDEIDIFVHDTQTGTTTRVNVGANGMQANDGGYGPDISADGRYVSFASPATNLVTGDTNGVWDAFVHDTQTGTTTRVSVDSNGIQADDDSYYSPRLSGDGRYVVFESYARNLVEGDTNGRVDIFRHDIQTGNTIRVSVSSSGTQSAYESDRASISANGRFVEFRSLGHDFVPGDTNITWDIFVRDIENSTTKRVSVDSNGGQTNLGIIGRSLDAEISGDGRYVAFSCEATNLVANDTNNTVDVFVHDTQTGSTVRISADNNGVQANGLSWSADISDDGRYVTFQSVASNLVATDTVLGFDIFHALNTTHSNFVASP